MQFVIKSGFFVVRDKVRIVDMLFVERYETMNYIINSYKNFKKYRYLLFELVKKDIKLKYRSSYLGLLWTLLEPILTTLVLSYVMGPMLGRDDKLFVIYILIGRLIYAFFSGATKTAMRSIRRYSGMIKKVYVPKYIYPLSAILSNFVTFALSLIVLVIACIIKRVEFTSQVFLIIFPLFILLVMALGVGLFLATFSVYFRDLEYLWDVMLMLIMYCSAIFYHVDSLGPSIKKLLQLNPLYNVIANCRYIIFYGRDQIPMSTKYLAYSAGFSIVALIVGLIVFRKNQDKFILHI